MMGFERANVPCSVCGVDNPTERCGSTHHSHNAGQCLYYGASQREVHKMDALEAAWTVIKAKKDAPNYRMTGYCEWYDFMCRADHVCDAWAGMK